MKKCKYGEYKPFLMDETIEQEIDSIITLAKFSNWRICYWEKRKFLSRQIQIRMPFYYDAHEIRIQISNFNNKAKKVDHYLEEAININQPGIILTRSGNKDSSNIENLNNVYYLLNNFKKAIIECKK